MHFGFEGPSGYIQLRACLGQELEIQPSESGTEPRVDGRRCVPSGSEDFSSAETVERLSTEGDFNPTSSIDYTVVCN